MLRQESPKPFAHQRQPAALFPRLSIWRASQLAISNRSDRQALFSKSPVLTQWRSTRTDPMSRNRGCYSPCPRKSLSDNVSVSGAHACRRPARREAKSCLSDRRSRVSFRAVLVKRQMNRYQSGAVSLPTFLSAQESRKSLVTRSVCREQFWRN